MFGWLFPGLVLYIQAATEARSKRRLPVPQACHIHTRIATEARSSRRRSALQACHTHPYSDGVEIKSSSCKSWLNFVEQMSFATPGYVDNGPAPPTWSLSVAFLAQERLYLDSPTWMDLVLKRMGDGDGGRSAPGTPSIFSSASSDAPSFASGISSSLHRSSVVPQNANAVAKGSSSAKTFDCNKCKLRLPFSMMSKFKPGCCESDQRSYKSLTERWAKCRSLKDWFQNLGEEERTAWYLRHQGRGIKRNFDEIAICSKGESFACGYENEIDAFITWTEFKRYGLLEGKPLKTIVEEWDKALMDAGSEAKFVRGQWLLPEFKGVQRISSQGTRVSAETSRSSAVDSAEKLLALRQQADAAVAEFHGTFKPAKCYVGEAEPQVDVDPAMMPTTRHFENTMARHIDREV